MRISILASLPFILSVCVQAQTSDTLFFEVKGKIRDEANRVVPGLRLDFASETSRVTTLTDINGYFQVRLGKGTFEVMADPIPSVDFKLILRITDGPLNPEYLDLKVSSANICSDWLRKSPKSQKIVTPNYPPAALAVRATGDVSVKVTLDPSGNVLLAEPISGHPLLRAAGRKAAENFVFESTATSDARTAILTFSFLDPELEKPGLERLNLPCRIVVNANPPIIEATETNSR